MGGTDDLFIDGSRYISTSVAAKEFGFARDYIARLCRQNAVRGKQVGSNWYVDLRSLQHYLSERDARRDLRNEELRRAFREKTPAFDPSTPSAAEPAPASPSAQIIPPPELHTHVQNRRSIDRRRRVMALSALSFLLVLIFAATSAAFDPALAKTIGHDVASASMRARAHQQTFSNFARMAKSDPGAFSASAATGAANFLRAIASWLDPIANLSPQLTYYRISPSAQAPAPVATTAANDAQYFRAAPTIINNYTLSSAPAASLSNAGGVTEDILDRRLGALQESVALQLYAFSRANSAQLIGAYQAASYVSPPSNTGSRASGASAWGGISGVLSDQTDLAANLASKLTLSDWYATSTDALREGAGHLYFTDARVGDVIDSSSTIPKTYTDNTFTGTTTLSVVALANDNCSSLGNGGKLTTDAFGYLICAADQGGSGSTVAGTDGQIQFNDGGSIGASAGFTFSTSTGKLAVLNASTTNISASGVGYFASASTTSITIGTGAGFLQASASGLVSATSTFSASSLFGILAVGHGGTGTSTAPAFGQVLLGNAGGGYDLVATSSLGITSAAWGAITGTLANQTDLQNMLNAKFPLTDWYATSTDALREGTANLYWTNLRFDTRLSATTTLPKLTTLANLASVGTITSGTWSGLFGAVSGANLTHLTAANIDAGTAGINVTGNAATATKLATPRAINNVSFDGSAPITISAASSSLLSDNNVFSGDNTFTGSATFGNATSTNLFSTTASSTNLFATTATFRTASSGSLTLGSPLGISSGGTNASSFTSGQIISYDGTRFVSTSTIGNGQLANSAIGVTAGSGLSGGGSVSLGGSTSLSLDLAHANSWTGLQTFANASTTLGTFATTWFTGNTSALLSTDANGKLQNTTVSSPLTFSGSTLSILNAAADGTTKGAAAFAAADFNDNGAGLLSLDYTNGQKASGSQPGFLTSADFTTFNNKLASSSIATSALLASLLSDETGTGSVVFSASPTFTGTSVFANASTTNISASSTGYFGTASTTNLIVGTGAGFLQANGAGVVSATSTFSASNIFGTLGVPNGGTGSTTLTGILKGNGTGAVQSAIAGADYENPLTFTTGLNRTGNTITNTGVLAIGPTGQTQTGTVILATTTTGTDFTITATGGTINFNLPTASASNRGLLSSADWTTFNSKVSASRTLTAGAGLTGGGDLSADRTFAIDFTRANTWTGLQQFNAASTTLFSSYGPVYFGSSATSSFSSTGALTLSTALAVGSGGTGAATLSGLLQGNGGSAFTAVGGTAGQFPYFNGTNTLLATSSLFLATSGNVGIGTTGPGTKLDIKSSTAGLVDYLRLSSTDANATNDGQRLSFYDTPDAVVVGSIDHVKTGLGQYELRFNNWNGLALNQAMTINTAGNVGIGTTTPDTSLFVRGTGTGNILTLQGGIASTGDGPGILFQQNTGSNLKASIQAPYVSSTNNLELAFSTSNSGTLAERMRILGNGNVGVGTASPTAKLHLYSNTASAPSTLKIESGSAVGAGYGSEIDLNTSISGGRNWTIRSSSTGDGRFNGGMFGISDETAGVSRFQIDSSGNVGIGTTAPGAPLEVRGQTSNTFNGLFVTTNTWALTSAGSVIRIGHGASSGNTYGSIENLIAGGIAGGNLVLQELGGNVGIGTTTPGSALSIAGGVSIGANYAATAPSNGLIVQGNVGFGTTTPAHPLTVQYTSNIGAGMSINDSTPQNGNTFIQFKNNMTITGTITSNGVSTLTYGTASDRRLKDNIATTTSGLSLLSQIKVADYSFINDPSHTKQQGLIAQELYDIYPTAVHVGGADAKTDPWQVDYGRITPLIVQAVQDIANIASTFQHNLIAWLGNATNGIIDLFAQNGHFNNELCVGSTCVTPAQFQAMVEAATPSPSNESSPSTRTGDEQAGAPIGD